MVEGPMLLPKNGAGIVHFLVEHFTFLGFDGQYWMLVVVALTAIYILYVWKSGDWI